MRSYWAAAECVGNHEDIEGSGLFDHVGNALVDALGLVTGSTETKSVAIEHKIWGFGLIWSVHETNSFFYSIHRGGKAC